MEAIIHSLNLYLYVKTFLHVIRSHLTKMLYYERERVNTRPAEAGSGGGGMKGTYFPQL